MNKIIMVLIAMAIIGTTSVLGVMAGMEDDDEELQDEMHDDEFEEPVPSTPSTTNEVTGETVYEFEGTVDGGRGPTGGCHNHHFLVNDSVTKMAVVFRWEDTRWDLDVSIGKGDCPVSGEVVEEDTGGSIGNGEGEVILGCSDPETLKPEGGEKKWFAHLEPDPYAYDCDYTIIVTVTYVYLVEG